MEKKVASAEMTMEEAMKMTDEMIKENRQLKQAYEQKLQEAS
ncbi:MAG: hypothetical protein ACOC2W_00635 [bacterium]